MIEHEVLEDDLDVAVGVDVGQRDRRAGAQVWRGGDRLAFPLERAVMLEAVNGGLLGLHDDLGDSVVVDVADCGGRAPIDRLRNFVVESAGGPVEHVEVAGGGRGREREQHDVGDVAEVDLAVVVVVGQVADQRSRERLVVAVIGRERPLQDRREAVGGRDHLAGTGRVAVVLHLALVDRLGDVHGPGADVELDAVAVAIAWIAVARIAVAVTWIAITIAWIAIAIAKRVGGLVIEGDASVGARVARTIVAAGEHEAGRSQQRSDTVWSHAASMPRRSAVYAGARMSESLDLTSHRRTWCSRAQASRSRAGYVRIADPAGCGTSIRSWSGSRPRRRPGAT